MALSIMKMRELGIANKPIWVCPKHLLQQTANEFYHAFPTARLLVATAMDFKKGARARFLNKMAYGSFDAIILTEEQFKAIPLSLKYQEKYIYTHIDELEEALNHTDDDDRFSVKQIEKKLRSLQVKLLNIQSEIDEHRDAGALSFESYGIDALFVDEAHRYKNLGVNTSAGSIAGINTGSSQKAIDMEMKCQFISKLRSERLCNSDFESGIVMATATPISNSLCELYVMQRYLRPGLLRAMGVYNFDAWRKNFGELVSAIEIKPEGTGYQRKVRFSRFINLPELMNMVYMFSQISDGANTSFKLPVPHRVNIAAPSVNETKAEINHLASRAEAVRHGAVMKDTDNMLKIISDGKKLGLDIRLVNSDYPDYPESKVNLCVANIVKEYEKLQKQTVEKN